MPLQIHANVCIERMASDWIYLTVRTLMNTVVTLEMFWPMPLTDSVSLPVTYVWTVICVQTDSCLPFIPQVYVICIYHAIACACPNWLQQLFVSCSKFNCFVIHMYNVRTTKKIWKSLQSSFAMTHILHNQFSGVTMITEHNIHYRL